MGDGLVSPNGKEVITREERGGASRIGITNAMHSTGAGGLLQYVRYLLRLVPM